MQDTIALGAHNLDVNIENAPEHLATDAALPYWQKLLSTLQHAREPMPELDNLPLLYIELEGNFSDNDAKDVFGQIVRENGPTIHKLIEAPKGKHGMFLIYPPNQKEDCHHALPNILYRRHPDMLRLYIGFVKWRAALAQVAG